MLVRSVNTSGSVWSNFVINVKTKNQPVEANAYVMVFGLYYFDFVRCRNSKRRSQYYLHCYSK